jgi:hypothetical protein
MSKYKSKYLLFWRLRALFPYFALYFFFGSDFFPLYFDKIALLLSNQNREIFLVHIIWFEISQKIGNILVTYLTSYFANLICPKIEFDQRRPRAKIYISNKIGFSRQLKGDCLTMLRQTQK